MSAAILDSPGAEPHPRPAGRTGRAGGAHAHPPDPPGLGVVLEPAQFSDLVAALAGAAGGLPQLLGQLDRWLVAQQRAGRLRDRRMRGLAPRPGRHRRRRHRLPGPSQPVRARHGPGHGHRAPAPGPAGRHRPGRPPAAGPAVNASTPAGVDPLAPTTGPQPLVGVADQVQAAHIDRVGEPLGPPPGYRSPTRSARSCARPTARRRSPRVADTCGPPGRSRRFPGPERTPSDAGTSASASSAAADARWK
jgi:hypothetical protein